MQNVKLMKTIFVFLFYVNEQKNIVIHIISKSQDELNNLKYKIGIIKKYLEETKPILESKILMEALRQKILQTH